MVRIVIRAVHPGPRRQLVADHLAQLIYDADQPTCVVRLDQRRWARERNRPARHVRPEAAGVGDARGGLAEGERGGHFPASFGVRPVMPDNSLTVRAVLRVASRSAACASSSRLLRSDEISLRRFASWPESDDAAS